MSSYSNVNLLSVDSDKNDPAMQCCFPHIHVCVTAMLRLKLSVHDISCTNALVMCVECYIDLTSVMRISNTNDP